jgi:hypothetical protein
MVIQMEDKALPESELKFAETMAATEINEIMADIEIIEEQFENTFLFKDFKIKDLAIQHLQKFKKNKDGTSFDDSVLTDIYKFYFPPNVQKG